MKKSELEYELQISDNAKERFKELNRELNNEVKDLTAMVEKLGAYKAATERALVAIEAIIVVGCPTIKAWNEMSHYFHELEAQGKAIPDKPEDKMYEALGHLQHMLNMPSVSATNLNDRMY